MHKARANDINPTLAPSGTTVAYKSDVGGSHLHYVRYLAGSSPSQPLIPPPA